MKVSDCAIPGPLLIEPVVHTDDRGFFFESWNSEAFDDAGLSMTFVQDNHVRSGRGVLRGLHFQNPLPQGKLIRVVAGAIWDVAVDLRRSSPTFGAWAAATLTAENHAMFWVPEGFAHGYLSLSDVTDVLYKCTAPYHPKRQHVLAWDDPTLAIDWPLSGLAPLISDRDQAGLALADVRAFA